MAKVILLVVPRSTKVELFEESNWTWFEQLLPHNVPVITLQGDLEIYKWNPVLANSRDELPVSNTT